jgi:dUTP pyrophosphatase
MPTIARKQKAYRRGDAKHYAKLARKSVDSRIKRHIEAELVLDTSRVTKSPLRKRETDAGYDVATPTKVVLQPGASEVVALGVFVKCPPGYFYEIRGRSSLNGKLLVTNDIIDATYTGEIRVRAKNIGSEVLTFNVGDRIAQLIFLPQIHVKFREVPSFKVQDGERGEAGFGSTGN